MLLRAAASNSAVAGTPAPQMFFQDVVERIARYSMGHLRVSPDQPAIRVPSMSRITGHSQQCRQRPITEADVEYRIEHAGHGYCRSRSHRDEQRLAVSSKGRPRGPFKLADSLTEERDNAVGQVTPLVEVRAAHGRGNDKTWRHRQTGDGHTN